MAISYDLDQISTTTPSRKSAFRAARYENDLPRDPNGRPIDAHWDNVKQIRPLKQAGPRVGISSRAQLIESIKRGENPTWLPNPALGALAARYNAFEEDSRRLGPLQPETFLSGLVPGNSKTSSKQGLPSPTHDLEPAEIERPRSALHTGDFFENRFPDPNSQVSSSPLGRSASPPSDLLRSPLAVPWHTPAVPSLPPHSAESNGDSWSRPVDTRSRAPSLGSSLSSSFVFRPPTSPLVYAASNSDLELPLSTQPVRQTTSPERGNRRRTLPPDNFYSFQAASSASGVAPIFSRSFLPARRESSLPYQAHQPRRSWASTSINHESSSLQTPTSSRSRRPSFSSENPPMHHASMVGSFEESILRGRMSTAPSRPIDFVAQIGVLGRGDCKPNLKCPAHVSVPFPAVFYNYPSVGKRSFSDDSPSPYVGTIDLEHSLKPIETKKARRHAGSPAPSVDALMKDITAPENTHIGLAIDRKKRERQRKRSTSPKGPFGGCYRVPQQGQLQIVIKNPNKTAVKLYLVPYNLDDMEAGTKTFVRQRSFSAGPILEKSLTDNSPAMLSDPFQHKTILRYLIHLKFCCPSKGRFYLHDNIRVVFANRVPDENESLRNEVQLPEPRYSCYRPSREPSMGSAGAKLAAEKASRRRSSGFGVTPAGVEAMDGLTYTGPFTALTMGRNAPAPSTPIPFHIMPRLQAPLRTDLAAAHEEKQNEDASFGIETMDIVTEAKFTAESNQPELRPLSDQLISPLPGLGPSTSTRTSPVPWAAFSQSTNGNGSPLLSRTVSPVPAERGEWLLARELRSKDTQKSTDADD